MNKAVFLDKDGTIIHDAPYNVNLQKMRLFEDSISSLKALRSIGFKLIILTNQSGIARGYHTEGEYLLMRNYLTMLFRTRGVLLDGFYHCPHLQHGLIPKYSVNCSCRKPKSGMLLQAAAEHSIDLTSSWMVGDILDDIEAGNKAFCNTILIDRGNETKWESGVYREPHHLAANLTEAVEIITDEDAMHFLTL